jgi:hypothetical protein
LDDAVGQFHVQCGQEGVQVAEHAERIQVTALARSFHEEAIVRVTI